jgi:SAM-dependent methyltransferase
MKEAYTKINARTWDCWAENECEWSRPVTEEEYQKAKCGEWGVFLTPCITVPHSWFGKIQNKMLLGLASGGGQQMPIFTALGACCTIFDNSDRQLESEKMVSEREGYSIKIVKGDMSKPLPFENEAFDIIFHPVSNCYIEDVLPLWRECYRVLKKGGILLAGFCNGIDFLFEGDSPLTVVNRLPYNPLKMETDRFNRMADNLEGILFSHSLEEQLGGQLNAGFILTDLYEDRDREGGAAIREYAPQYMATRTIKPEA